ncbi:MAG TPA: ABC transporter substrate-binding protein [Stellaceae bacterium]|nr:ABC transporter substrate-binding protein [Stellaceae bacterium]
MRRSIGLFAVALGLLAATALPSGAQTKIAVSYFPGPGTGPVFAGIENGTFAKEGVSVDPESTNGSVAQITAMLDDKYQVAFGGLDDVIGYDAGQGEVPVKVKPDLFAFMGTDSGSLHLVTAPDVKRVEDLKGRTVAVDAKLTGFAFVLYRIAALHGLKAGDYNVLSVGSSQKRFEALSSGAAQGAVMFKPVADLLVAKGFNDLMPTSQVFPHYQAAVVLARRSWAVPHRATLIGFIRAYLQSMRWFTAPANKEAAIRLLLKFTPNLSRPGAEASYRTTIAMIGPTGPIGAIDPAGVATAVKLREIYGEPKKKLGDPRQFYDLSYYRAALRH